MKSRQHRTCSPYAAPLASEKGLAMVLAITLVGLLSSFGIYLILQSGAELRMTKALARHEAAVSCAEAGVQVGLRCIRSSPPSPTFNELSGTASGNIMAISEGLPSYMGTKSYPENPPSTWTAPLGTVTSRIDYIGYKTTPPAGWMLNWQGYSSFHGVFFRPVGNASIPLATSQEFANSVLSTLTLRVSR